MAKKTSGGKTVTRTSTARKTIVRKDKPVASAQASSTRGAQRPATGRPTPRRAARPRAEPDPPVPSQAEMDAEDAARTAAFTEPVGERTNEDVTRHAERLKAAGPHTREQLTAARDEVRGKLAAVTGLAQYATEEADYQAALDALEQALRDHA